MAIHQVLQQYLTFYSRHCVLKKPANSLFTLLRLFTLAPRPGSLLNSGFTNTTSIGIRSSILRMKYFSSPLFGTVLYSTTHSSHRPPHCMNNKKKQHLLQDRGFRREPLISQASCVSLLRPRVVHNRAVHLSARRYRV